MLCHAMLCCATKGDASSPEPLRMRSSEVGDAILGGEMKERSQTFAGDAPGRPASQTIA